MDTQDRSQGNVPHMTQVNWSFNGHTKQGSINLLINGHHYYKGRGNPGSASSDEYNNCLIDSIRQCLGLECNRKLVRQDLERNYGCASGRAKVTEMSYLDVEHHAQDIIRSLFRHNTSGQQSECNIADFCVVALYANQEGTGSVVGQLTAPNHLVVLNTSDIHFDPCLRL